MSLVPRSPFAAAVFTALAAGCAGSPPAQETNVKANLAASCPAAAADAGAPSAQPTAASGTRHRSPVLSDDGTTIAWASQSRARDAVFVGAAPFSALTAVLAVESRAGDLDVALSGDGKHLYWWGPDGQLTHAGLARGRLTDGPDLLLVCGGGAGLAADGPGDNVLFTEARRVRVATKSDGEWHLGLPFGEADGTALEPRLGPEARVVFLQRRGEANQLVEHLRDGLRGRWIERSVTPPGLAPFHVSLTRDGAAAVLVAAFPERSAADAYLYTMRLEGRTWSAPELVMKNGTSTLHDAAIASNGSWIAWAEDQRAPREADGIVASEVRAMHREGGGWSVPATLFRQDAPVRIAGLVAAGDGTIAWAVTRSDRDDQLFVSTASNRGAPIELSKRVPTSGQAP